MSLQNEGRSWVSAARRAFRFTLVAAWLAACGGAVGHTGAGGESHFLHHCESSCGSGLKCISGVCTRGCELGSNECDDLAKRATCTDQSVEPGQIAACDVDCRENADCSLLGADYACESGFCRAPALPGQQPPTGSGGSGGSSSSSGGSSSSSGGSSSSSGGSSSAGKPSSGGEGPTTPAGCESAEDCPTDFECVRDLQRDVGVCVDASRNADCSNDTPCPDGYECGEGAHGPTCFPVSVNCTAPWACDAANPAECPAGFARSRVGGTTSLASCFGACVELTACACDEATICPAGSSCASGQCTTDWTRPALCSLPFEVGPCKALMPVFTYQDGRCVEADYGGCDGNENRFRTLDECLQTCAGVPYPHGCPGGEKPASVCLECGLTGGCAKAIDACPRPCEVAADCGGTGLSCDGGVCGSLRCF